MSRNTTRPRATATARKLREALAELESVRDGALTFLEVVRELNPRFRTLGRTLTWLAVYDEDHATRERAASLLWGVFQDPSVPRRIHDKLAEQVVPFAEQALRDPGLVDERKLVLSPILSSLGRELTDEELATCFADLPGALAQAARKAGAGMADAADQVEASLHMAGLVATPGQGPVSPENVQQALGMAAVASEGNGPLGATALAVTAAVAFELGHPDTDGLCAALETAARADPERALALLSELATWPNAGALGVKAGELSERLRGEGVSPRPVPAPRFSHGLVSRVDGAGSRAFQLLFQHDDGTLDALCVLVNDRVGLKDVWCAFGEGAELELQLRESGLEVASCDQAFARGLIADALATSAEAGRVLPGRWLLYRSFLGDAPLAPARRAPDLSAYELEALARSPALAADSEELADEAAYDGLGFSSDAAYAFVRAQPPELGALEIDEPLITSFVQAIEPHERERLTRRLATNLEHEARAGRAEEGHNRLAARTWLALSERLLPFEEVPYVRALAEESLDAIEHNLALGYESEDEANQATLDEPELEAMLQE